MARYVFPDVNDRSPNNPMEIVEKDRVLGLYNQEHGEDALYITETVKEWFKAKAGEQDWSNASFAGNQAILTANVKVENNGYLK